VFARDARQVVGHFRIVGGKNHSGKNLGLLAMIFGARHEKFPFT
jgi:hypothetical protein